MSFKFGLASLLRLRQLIEQRCETELAVAQQRVTAFRSEILNLERTLVERHESKSQQLCGGSSASELHFHYECESKLRSLGKQVQHRLCKAEEDRDEKLREYVHARRGREALEILFEEQWQHHLKEERRRQQQAFDDLFLMRLRSNNGD